VGGGDNLMSLWLWYCRWSSSFLTCLTVARSSFLFLAPTLDFSGSQSFQAKSRVIRRIRRLFEERHLASFFLF
jgi:hypothetical protein